MKCDKCGRKVGSRREELEHVLEKHADKITSHEKDEMKRELNRLEKESSTNSPPVRKLGVAALVLAVVVGGGYAMSSAGILSLSTGNGSPTGNAVADIDGSNDPVLGNASAPVTVTLFEDFECPFCKRFDSDVMTRIKADYVDTGEVKVVWKDFPLTYAADMHPWSDEAAVAMECVYRQDESAFWTVKNHMFENQARLSTDNVQERVKGWAADAGVAREDVQACIDVGDAEREVRADFQEGQSIGVQGTPTVFVDGRPIQNPSYDAISRAIENN